MEPKMLESWIVGVLFLILLVAFHWFAFRVGKSRSRAPRRTYRGGGRGSASGEGLMFTNEPLEPQ